VEVAPIAHYHMGGIRVDTAMATGVPGLFAAGEAVGVANGANRLSGNAITEALAFGRAAGRSAAAFAATPGVEFAAAAAAPSLALATATGPARNTATLFAKLQAVMADQVGPFRAAAGLDSALTDIHALREAAGAVPPGAPGAHDLTRLDWFDLRQGLLVAEAIILSAQARQESRGAHQREDFPGLDEAWTLNQTLRLRDGALHLDHQVPA
jgi:succinate dehydrogenase/fumarate reductase flavoprotein subunit